LTVERLGWVIEGSVMGSIYLAGSKTDILADVSKRLVDIDDGLLDEAASILGAATMKETVNRSLEAVVLAARRRRHADRLESMQRLDLAKPKVMSGAWR
jgi:Arc/MetJ family transcription regulator